MLQFGSTYFKNWTKAPLFCIRINILTLNLFFGSNWRLWSLNQWLGTSGVDFINCFAPYLPWTFEKLFTGVELKARKWIERSLWFAPCAHIYEIDPWCNVYIQNSNVRFCFYLAAIRFIKIVAIDQFVALCISKIKRKKNQRIYNNFGCQVEAPNSCQYLKRLFLSK